MAAQVGQKFLDFTSLPILDKSLVPLWHMREQDFFKSRVDCKQSKVSLTRMTTSAQRRSCSWRAAAAAFREWSSSVDCRRQRAAFGNVCSHRLHDYNAAIHECAVEVCFATWRAHRCDAKLASLLDDASKGGGKEEMEDELNRRYAQLKTKEEEPARRLALLKEDEAQLEKRRVEVEELAKRSKGSMQAKVHAPNPVSIEPKLESEKDADSRRSPDGDHTVGLHA
jgi:uncharacterized protein YecT (DUF1311 family)